MIRTICLLVLLLVLAPMTSSAQKGWVRMADGPWGKASGVFFLSTDTGFVEERLFEGNPAGSILHFTFDGGKTWRTDTYLQTKRTQCIRKDDLIATPLPKDFHMSHLALNLAGSVSYSGCTTYGSEGYAWRFDFASGTWSMQSLSNNVDTIIALSDKVLFASYAHAQYFEPGKGASVNRSTDGGKTWHRIFGISGERGGVIPRFQSKDSGYVRSFAIIDSRQISGVHWTSNGGKTWRTDSAHLVDSLGLSWQGPFYGNNGLWYDNSRFGLLSSSDLGLTWQSAVVPPIPQRVKPDDAFYSFDEGYRISRVDSSLSFIEYTVDSGGMWNMQQAIEGYLNEISAPNERIAYAVGPNGLLYKTTDGGGRFADVASAQPRESKLNAWSSGNDIIVEHASDEVHVYDLLGRVVRSGSGGRFDDLQPGMYVVVSDGKSVKVLVGPL